MAETRNGWMVKVKGSLGWGVVAGHAWEARNDALDHGDTVLAALLGHEPTAEESRERVVTLPTSPRNAGLAEAAGELTWHPAEPWDPRADAAAWAWETGLAD